MSEPQHQKSEQQWQGLGVSDGVALGKVLRVQTGTNVSARARLREDEIESEVARFQNAVAFAREQLTQVKAQAEIRLGAEHAYIFDSHLLMLEDRKLIGDAVKVVRERRISAEWAVGIVTDKILAVYADIKDDYLRARGSDIEDVAQRLLKILSDTPNERLQLSEDTIIVAEELLPSMVAELDFANVRAVVSDAGGWTSHAAIIARGLGIPAVVGLRDFYQRARTGDAVLVNANRNLVVLYPTHANIERHRELFTTRESKNFTTDDDAENPVMTRDDVAVTLRANVELPVEYEGVKRFGACGIGLYRSEFLWSQYERMPSEQQQFEAYLKIVEVAGKAGATIRFFDLGGDKVGLGGAPLNDTEHERNPALGLRAIRLMLRYEQVLRTQARACLRAAVHGNLKVVLPMVSDITDVRRARLIIEDEFENLKRENVSCGAIEIGAMIEVPSAVMVAESIAREVAFFSLGTNDLVQYMLAVDRGSETVAEWFRTLHPAVLRAIKHTLTAATLAGISATVCGEMAATPVYAFILLGLGARELSMTAGSIPRVRRLLREIDVAHATQISDACLACDSAEAVEELIRARLAAELPHLFPPESLPAPASRQ